MVNVGYNPTFGNDAVSVEAFLLDFDADIYGATSTLRLSTQARHRNAPPPPWMDLKSRIAEDVAIARGHPRRARGSPRRTVTVPAPDLGGQEAGTRAGQADRPTRLSPTRPAGRCPRRKWAESGDARAGGRCSR